MTSEFNDHEYVNQVFNNGGPSGQDVLVVWVNPSLSEMIFYVYIGDGYTSSVKQMTRSQFDGIYNIKS